MTEIPENQMLFYTDLPKVELHAHLNGSISSTTMKKLVSKKPHLQIQNGMTMIDKGQKRTLEECFEMFRIIHQITDTAEDILLVTKDVIREFAADGVKYLELRSTPRESPTGMTKRTYVETVLEGIRQCKEEELDIDVRLLIAIDRRAGSDVAKETVKLAEDFFHSSSGLVLGLDLSGDPTGSTLLSITSSKQKTKDMCIAYSIIRIENDTISLKEVGHGKDFMDPLSEAKRSGLKLALHLSEIPSQEEETALLLDLPPDRIGHGTFLCNSPDIVETVKRHQIPLELCLTSNIKGQTVPSFDKHHFGFWYNLGHPSVLCTDDKGVFATDLSVEYQLAASTFGLTSEQVWELSQQAIDYIFASESVKSHLKEKWTKLKPDVFRHVKGVLN